MGKLADQALKRLQTSNAFRSASLPVFLAPMAGVSTPKLVAAAANQGVVAFHGGAFRNVDQLRGDVREVRNLCGETPFGVNLFFYERDTSAEQMGRVQNAVDNVRPFYSKLGAEKLLDGIDLSERQPSFEEQIEVVLEEKVELFSFCFGCPPKEVIRDIKSNGSFVVGTATSVEEAHVLEEAGVDAIAAQGADAGGHRGSFLPSSSLVGTFSLVPQVVEAVSVPVIAAGGIMNGRGVAAALSLGASGAAMGTAFITCKESEAHRVHKERILNSRDVDTVVTDVFSGRSARGFSNEISSTLSKSSPFQQSENRHRVMEQQASIAPYPLQQQLTNPLKKMVLDKNPELAAEYISLWAGQGSALAKDQTVGDLVKSIRAHLEC